VTERFIRTDKCGSSSSTRRAILHEEAGYVYADCPFANFKPLAVRRRTIHYYQACSGQAFSNDSSNLRPPWRNHALNRSGPAPRKLTSKTIRRRL
jgi:hypothetical protein